MKWNMKNMLPAAALSLVAFTSALNAVDDTQVRNLENRVSALEQRKGSNGMINPPARPVVKDGSDIFITGEALYMKAQQNGLGYAVKADGFGPANPIDLHQDASMRTPDFEWDWGFRVGLGANLPHDGWDVYLNWTYFHNHVKHNTHVDENKGEGLFPSWRAPDQIVSAPMTIVTSVPLFCNDVDSKWKLNYNIFDLEMGREFFVSKWLTLRPFAGLRGAWVRDRFKVSYNGGDLVPVGEDLVRLSNRFWAIGLRGGLNTQWGLGCGWSVYADAALSLLEGRYDIRQYEKVDNSSGPIPRAHIKSDFNMTRAMMDLAVGLRYRTLFDNDYYGLTLQAGWEEHMFFGFNQYNRFPSFTNAGDFVSNLGDLSLKGVSFQVKLDF